MPENRPGADELESLCSPSRLQRAGRRSQRLPEPADANDGPPLPRPHGLKRLKRQTPFYFPGLHISPSHPSPVLKAPENTSGFYPVIQQHQRKRERGTKADGGVCQLDSAGGHAPNFEAWHGMLDLLVSA